MSAGNLQPDRDRDVIVQHVTGDPGRGDQWVVFVGQDKRVELTNEQSAMVFARLLADLQQRRIWVCHDPCGELTSIDHHEIRGCSCC